MFHSFHGLMNSINWPASSVWVFIAQLGEHCSANAEAMGSNPVEAPKSLFFGLFRNYLNCDSLRWSHTHFICIPAVHIISFKNCYVSALKLQKRCISLRLARTEMDYNLKISGQTFQVVSASLKKHILMVVVSDPLRGINCLFL